uniref:HNH domain-containing protein n=1 Tax=Phaseolus vulgaris TaxID=3885 RepID=V7CAY1_PHAVU|nr:hypothetical protein PHAVU_003G189200g [Phaseolus vulgaris]ESW27294.1 hypothetical protein PHAVU_003G189200g [Phaseolus vulgaris]
MRGSNATDSSSREERRRRARSSSPLKDRSKPSSSKLSSSSSKRTTSSSATLLDVDDNVTSLSHDYPNPNPRSFPHTVKQKCWEKADKVKGRDPDRWRRDVLGNTIFRKLVGCPGCLCHDYDHIVPYSKGGESTLENCQVLQARTISLFPFEGRTWPEA